MMDASIARQKSVKDMNGNSVVTVKICL